MDQYFNISINDCNPCLKRFLAELDVCVFVRTIAISFHQLPIYFCIASLVAPRNKGSASTGLPRMRLLFCIYVYRHTKVW